MREILRALREIKWLTVIAVGLAAAGIVLGILGVTMTIVIALVGAAVVLAVIDQD